jgi:hypothetical protein
MAEKHDSIKAALGLGELFTLSNGATLPVAPCGLGDLEDAVELYSKTLNSHPLQVIFLPVNVEVKRDFDSLLLMASGTKYDVTKEDERKKALKVIYDKFTDVGDYGSEVVKYIKRFLRLIPRDAGPAEAQTEAEA